MPRHKGIIKRWNKYYYRISYNGKRIERGGYNTEEEAHRACSKHLTDLHQGKVSAHDITVKEFIIKYLKDHELTNNRRSTFDKVEGICRNHILSELGHWKLRNLTTSSLVD